MKKFLFLLVVLLTMFIGIWTVKAQSPKNRPDSYTDGVNYADGAWWTSSDNISEAAPEWMLDPEIPSNYLPVPGGDELYMVIDDDGNILGYRKRTLQEDGSWLWEDTNPDIPEHYEAVDGLDNVYKVTAEDGTVSYYRYIRNDDDTFAFIPVDENGHPLNDSVPDGNTIPDNYRHISGNVYAVLNEHGVIIGYKERRPNEDGTFTWVDCEKPIEKVGTSGGETSYNSNPGGSTRPGTNTVPGTTTPQVPQQGGTTGSGGTINVPGISGGGNVTQQADGTYVQTETLISTETAGGWTTTYQTIVTRVYSMDGTLLSTKKEGPTAISRVQAGNGGSAAPDPGSIASTLGEEYARVSTGLSYKAELAQAVLDELNAERAAEGLPALTMNTSSDAYRLAQVRAADMAIYDHSDFDSPTYGTLADMMNRFGISSAMPSENTWKTTTSKNAGAIHSRFMVLDGASAARMSANYTNIGIAIVQKNGYYYVCEILIN